MSTDLRIPDTFTQTVEKTAPSVGAADPWDAPYFGAPVYLAYQPTLAPQQATRPAAARVQAPTVASLDVATASERRAAPGVRAASQTTQWDPWDAPYFGAPVYLAYRAQPLACPSAEWVAPMAVASLAPGETADAARVAATPAAPKPRRATPNWLARLFGAGRGK